MKIFKKSMCLLLAVVMVLGMAITASAVETTETMSVTASKANPAVGEEFSIYLNASGDIAECGCFQMDLYYDQDLFEYVGANTAFTPNHNTNKTTGARYIRLTWLDLTSQTVIPKGQFCELKFKVLKAGEYHFQLTNIVNTDAVFGNPEFTLHRKGGRLPILAERGTATVEIQSATPFKVTALKTDGSPAGEIKGKVENGKFVFQADTASFPCGVMAMHLTR